MSYLTIRDGLPERGFTRIEDSPALHLERWDTDTRHGVRMTYRQRRGCWLFSGIGLGATYRIPILSLQQLDAEMARHRDIAAARSRGVSEAPAPGPGA
jgi:hypothetical protein